MVLILKAFMYGILAAIPAGPVNFDIIEHATCFERKKAFEVSIGAAIADGLIFFLLATFMPLLNFSTFVLPPFIWCFSALIFLTIGCYRLYRRFILKKVANKQQNDEWRGTSLAKGFFYVIINPGAYAFWTLIIILFHEQNLYYEYLILALGISLGAFSWFSLFIAFLNKMQSLYSKISQYAQTIVPLLFIVFGLFSLFKFFSAKFLAG